MVVDRVDASALCSMEPFLMLGSVVRIGLPTPFFVSSQYGIALVALNVRRGGWIPDASPKNRSSWLAISRMWCIVCVLPEREFPSQASHHSKGVCIMKIDSVLMDKVKDEYRRYYWNGTKLDDSGYKWAVSNIGGVVEFENGLLYVIEKLRIRTEFCFGYGQNGVSDEESFRFAVDGSNGVKQKMGFINANLRMFDREYGHLLEGKLFCYCICSYHNGKPVRIVRVSHMDNEHDYQVGEVTDRGRRKIAEEVGRMV